MATAHLIHGYIGAGKTTFARQLETRRPAIRFTPDEWMVRLYGTDPPADQFSDLSKRVSEQMDGVWLRCLALGLDVVLDFGFWSRRQRDEIRLRIRAQRSEMRLYHLSCSDDEAWSRIERRNVHPDGNLFISRNTFDLLKAQLSRLRRVRTVRRFDADAKRCGAERLRQLLQLRRRGNGTAPRRAPR
jgi:predicted kinase